MITTSDNGIIFVWRLPEKIAQCLQKVKNEANRLEAAIERTPSIIEEAEETDELGESAGPKDKKALKEGSNEDDDQDFDFDVPDKLKVQDRDSTMVRKRKEEVVDVLADIKKAANFVDQIVQKETPKLQKSASSKKVAAISSNDDGAVENDESEDDEAEVIAEKKKPKADYPFISKSNANQEESKA